MARQRPSVLKRVRSGQEHPMGAATDVDVQFVERPSGTPTGLPMAQILAEQIA